MPVLGPAITKGLALALAFMFTLIPFNQDKPFPQLNDKAILDEGIGVVIDDVIEDPDSYSDDMGFSKDSIRNHLENVLGELVDINIPEKMRPRNYEQHKEKYVDKLITKVDIKQDILKEVEEHFKVLKDEIEWQRKFRP